MAFDINNIRFNIIHHRGEVNTAFLDDGTPVYRQDKVWIDEEHGFLKCCPYDSHFVFLMPKRMIGVWSLVCSCGSPAVIVGSKVYSHLGSPEGKMIVCYHHTSWGKHADGSQ